MPAPRKIKKHMKKLRYIIAGMLLLAAAGCATSGDINRIEGQVSSAGVDARAAKVGIEDISNSLDAQAKREREMLATLKALEKGQAAIIEDLDVIKRNQADLGNRVNTMSGGGMTGVGGQMDELRHSIEATSAKLDALKATLLVKLSELEGGKGPGAAPDALEGRSIKSGTPPVSDPMQLYQSAYLDYTKGNYDVAVMGFREYLKAFPDAEFAGNAQYWIGESLYSLAKYEDAVAEFDRVIKNYPDSQKVPGAMLKKAYCYDALKKPDEAKAAVDALIKKFPESEAAKLAKERFRPKARGKVPGR